MIRNLCGYAHQGGKLGADRIEAIYDTCEKAAADGTLMIYSPQFLVTAS